MRRQMVDGDDIQDTGDRVLVRPYIQQHQPPDDGVLDPATVLLPAVTAAPPTTAPEVPDQVAEEKERRTVLWLVGAALVLSVATAALVVAIWPDGGDTGPAPLAVPTGRAVLPAVGADPSAAPATKASGASVASSSSPISRSPSPSGSPSASKAPASESAATTLAPPAADRVGAITGPGGHCLDVEGGIALLGNPLAAEDCNEAPSQRWTVASDGTLRTGGGCAAAGDGNAVQVSVCGTSDAGQWRARSGGTLINVGAGRCLTDPENGSETGTTLRLNECGSRGQHWTLP